MVDEKMKILNKVVQISKEYSRYEIESSVIEYISEKCGQDFYYNEQLAEIEGYADKNLITQFECLGFPIDLEFIVEFFESLLETENINENGIVFTPRYIADYIVRKSIESHSLSENVKAIDPGCGCGIFLIAFADYIHKKTGKAYKEIINQNIYGFEIDSDNARRCVIVLNLLATINHESNERISVQVKCDDALKNNWCDAFCVESFDYIIGNPPYVNTHDMNKETARFLKESFQTTKVGVYNIFYAFVEHGMNFVSKEGALSYIVPNNFLFIKSAVSLRKFIADKKYLESIIDFADNMVFRPVRTYNCIIRLSRQENTTFDYCVLEKVDNIENALNEALYDQMNVEKLDENGWKLVDRITRRNISRIESQFICIKEFVRTGIATLKDEVYIVDRDSQGFYKKFDGQRYDIESDIVKRLYKIPELKGCGNIEEVCRYIIFPYRKGDSGFSLLDEESFSREAPKAYRYLLKRKNELDMRDKGKPNLAGWYAYGRTQGLTKYGKKLVFPTFAFDPRFVMVDDEYALFCNGYAVFENEFIDLAVLQKILNSKVMQYYVNNTSYSIEGGYFCYQKKYIERFSLPLFSEKEINLIMNTDGLELDRFLISKYGLENVV